MKASRWFMSTSICTSLGLALTSCPAMAQAPEEIVVTAERFGSGLSRATFTLSAGDIDQRPFGSEITQSLAKVPGIQVSTGDARGGSFSFEIYMRGLTDEQIGLTLDGIPTGDSRFNGGSPPARFIESSNIAKVVVSQSSGDIGAPSRFALGGFINFVTDAPRKEAGGTIEAGVGSFDFWRVFGRIDTGEIAPGLTAYATYSHQDNDIWAGRSARSSRRDHAEFKAVKSFENGSSLQARVSYNDQRDNDFNILTLGEFQANRTWDRANDVLTGIPARDIDYGGALGGERKDMLAYLNANIVLTDKISLAVNPYYQTLRGESYRYQDRARSLAGADPAAVTGYNATGGAIRPALTTLRDSNAFGGPADMRVTPRDRDRYGVTNELKAEDLIQGHTLRAGFWWEGGKSTENRNFYRILNSANSIAYDDSRLNYVEYRRRADVTTKMFYAQDQIKFLDDRLKLDLGVTYYDIRYDAKSPLEYRANVKFSQDSKVNPKLGASYKLPFDFELFGGYAKNFAGIPEDAFLGSTAVISPNDLKPTTTENFDVGVRYVRPNMAFSVQGYGVNLKNNVGIVPRDTTLPVDIDEVIRGNVATRAANTGGTRSRGVEVTGFYDFGTIDLYGAYSYQMAKHDNPAFGTVERANLAALAIIGGARVRDIPRHSFFGQVGWTPVPDVRLEFNGKYVGDRVGGHIVEPVTFREAGLEMLKSYTVFGASAQYRIPQSGLGDLRFQVNVDNLFDRHYLGAVSGSTATQPEFGLTSGPAVRTLDRYFIGAPRTVTVSMRAKF